MTGSRPALNSEYALIRDMRLITREYGMQDEMLPYIEQLRFNIILHSIVRSSASCKILQLAIKYVSGNTNCHNFRTIKML